MGQVFDAAWRAAAYCLHWRVIALSLVPLLLLGGSAFGLAYFYWEGAIDAVRAFFESFELLSPLFAWLDSIGAGGLRSFLAPLVVVMLATPVLVVLCLLAVAAFMTQAMVNLVAARRFPELERRQGGSFVGSIFLGLGTTLLALIALVVSIPFWLVPPLVLVLPPLIWGWLTYRLMSYDVLANHANKEERAELLRRHRPVLIGMGVLSGYLGTAPSMVWVSGAATLILAPFLMLVAIWIYTLVFAFAGLWFSHFALAVLASLRREREVVLIEPVLVATPPALPPAEPPLVLPPA